MLFKQRKAFLCFLSLFLTLIMTSLLVTPIVHADTTYPELEQRLLKALEKAQALLAQHDHNIAKAYEIMVKPENGMFDIEKSGLHIFSFDKQDAMIFDLSDQVPPGMVLTGFQDMSGVDVIPAAQKTAEQPYSFQYSQGGWPHPVNGQILPSILTCRDTGQAYVCAMIWKTES